MKNKRTGVILLISILSLFASAFYFPAKSENKDIVITEIAAYETSSGENCEWIEIYNKSDRKVNLSEWRFWEGNVNHTLSPQTNKDYPTSTMVSPGEYALIADDPSALLTSSSTQNNCKTNYNLPTSTLILDSSWGSLSNNGEEIALKKSTSFLDVIEKFTYLSLKNCELRQECTSLERVSSQDLDYTSDNWKFLSTSTSTPNSTPGKPNYHQKTSVSINNFNPDFDVHSSSSVSKGVTTTFFENSTSTHKKEWNLEGDKNIQRTGGEIQYKFSDSGSYLVTLLGYDKKGAVSATDTEIEVTEPPEVSIESPSSSRVSSSTLFEANILNKSAPIANYLWNFGDSTTSTQSSTTHKYTSTGTYKTKLKIKDEDRGVGTATDSIKISPQLSSHTTSTTSDSELQVNIKGASTATTGQKVNFQAELSTSTPAEYDWSINNEKKSGSSTNYTFRSTSSYKIKLTASTTKQKTTDTHKIKIIEEKPNTTTPTSSDKIFINEFLPNTEQNDEWIEIYNAGSKQINLNGWSLHDGVGKIINIKQKIDPGSFVVHTLDNPKLNNAGDIILLKNKDNTTKDKISYGDWNSEDQSNSAAEPQPGNSLAKKPADKNIESNFFETTESTKGKENKITEPDKGKENNQEEEEIQKDSSDDNSDEKKKTNNYQKKVQPDRSYNKSDVVINEVMSDPKAGNEFIELYNNTNNKIELKGWQLIDGSENEKNLAGAVAPKEHFIQNYDSSILNNRGDLVKLISPKRKVIDKLIYGSWETEEENIAPLPDKGQVLARIPDGKDTDIYDKDFSIVSSTKGTANPKAKDKTKNKQQNTKADPSSLKIEGPKAVAQGEEVVFKAKLPPNLNHKNLVWKINTKQVDTETTTLKNKFKQTGLYIIEAWIIRKGEKITSAATQIKVKEKQKFSGGFIPTSDPSKIIISEILPNPKGSDKKEFIELFNPTTKPINLSGFKLDDEADGSDKYEFEEGTMIKPKSYAVFPRKETNIALNNSGDQVRILNSKDKTIKSIEYQQAQQGASFDGKTWSKIQTPGFKNEILEVKQPQRSKATANNKADYKRTPLSKVKRLKEGDKITTRGVVSVRPNTLGNRIFYIQGSPGLQIYNHKGKFPGVQLGDKIEVSGEISRAYGKLRLKTKDKFSIRTISHSGQPRPKQIEAEELNENTLANLVQIQGKITKTESDLMYISDRSDEVEVEIEEEVDIDPDKFEQKDLVQVTGIATTRDGEYTIKPRSSEDIEKTGTAKTNKDNQQNTDIKEENDLEKYIIATAGAIIIILLTLLLKEKRS